MKPIRIIHTNQAVRVVGGFMPAVITGPGAEEFPELYSRLDKPIYLNAGQCLEVVQDDGDGFPTYDVHSGPHEGVRFVGTQSFEV